MRADEGVEAISGPRSICLIYLLDLISDGRVSRDWGTTSPPAYRSTSGLSWIMTNPKQSSCPLVVEWNHYKEERCSNYTNTNKKISSNIF